MKALFFSVLLIPFYTLAFGQGVFDCQVCRGKSDCSDLSWLKSSKASVIVFLNPDCPIAQKYTLTLRNMLTAYSAKPVSMVGIISGKYYKVSDVRKFTRKYKITFPVLFDRSQTLTRMLQAKVSPQAFLVDAQGATLYSGKIDNWFEALGVYRMNITEHYLTDALNSFLAGEPVKIPKTEAVGCLLEY